MVPSLDYWRRRADRLWKKWDAIDDPYGLPIDQFRRVIKIANEAATISMMLASVERELKAEL